MNIFDIDNSGHSCEMSLSAVGTVPGYGAPVTRRPTLAAWDWAELRRDVALAMIPVLMMAGLAASALAGVAHLRHERGVLAGQVEQLRKADAARAARLAEAAAAQKVGDALDRVQADRVGWSTRLQDMLVTAPRNWTMDRLRITGEWNSSWEGCSGEPVRRHVLFLDGCVTGRDAAEQVGRWIETIRGMPAWQSGLADINYSIAGEPSASGRTPIRLRATVALGDA